jgi:dienelactone hydrolase
MNMRAAFRLTCAGLLSLAALCAHAEVRTQSVAYKDGNVELQGLLAWDDTISGKRPGVMVVHEWWGLNDYAKHRAEMLAKLGYVAFAVDMYGKGKVTNHPKQAGEWATQIQANQIEWQQRAAKGLAVLKHSELVDTSRMAAIGYCFGGSTVMQLAYAGADLRGVASFHGSLPAVTAEQMGNIKAKIFAATGNADAFVPPEQVAAFEAALDKAGADWYLVSYGGARHAFTNPDASSYGIENLRYDPEADRRSWAELQRFLGEIFGPQQ